MDRNLALEIVRVTEAAALAAARLMGRGDRNGADEAATQAMRKTLGYVPIDGTVVIGEGERDEAPMLYIGEKVGDGSPGAPAVDIAVDPLEGTNLCATGDNDSISVIAMAESGRFLNAPDTYMEKIAAGPVGRGVIDIRKSATFNLKALARAKGVAVLDLTAIILERDRHKALIDEVRAAGARIRLIRDGDIAGALATCDPATGIDILLGTGGAPEGVLAAAALRCVGGAMQGILRPRNPAEAARARAMGVKSLDHVYQIDELASGEVVFAATGVTDGALLKGVRFLGDGAETQSIVMRSKSGTSRVITARHRFQGGPSYDGAVKVGSKKAARKSRP